MPSRRIDDLFDTDNGTTPSAFQIYDSAYTDDDWLVCTLRDVDAGKRHLFHCSSEESVDVLQTAPHEGKWT